MSSMEHVSTAFFCNVDPQSSAATSGGYCLSRSDLYQLCQFVPEGFQDPRFRKPGCPDDANDLAQQSLQPSPQDGGQNHTRRANPPQKKVGPRTRSVKTLPKANQKAKTSPAQRSAHRLGLPGYAAVLVAPVFWRAAQSRKPPKKGPPASR